MRTPLPKTQNHFQVKDFWPWIFWAEKCKVFFGGWYWAHLPLKKNTGREHPKLHPRKCRRPPPPKKKPTFEMNMCLKVFLSHFVALSTLKIWLKLFRYINRLANLFVQEMWLVTRLELITIWAPDKQHGTGDPAWNPAKRAAGSNRPKPLGI